MAGTFTIGQKMVRPGVYFRRTNGGDVSTAGATNGVLACLFQSNWGALNKEVDLDVTMRNELSDYYGDYTEILREGFTGGAITIRAVRVGGDDGEVSKIILKGTKTVEVDDDLENSTETVEFDAVEISAAYVGDRKFTATVRTNLITEQRELLIYSGEEIFSRITFEAGENEAENLVSAMSLNKNFNARLLENGKLNDIVQAELTGGKNPTVTVSSYDRGTNVLERFKWNCIVADSDSAAVAEVLSSFVSQSYETGHLGFFCVGGKSSQDLDTRIQIAAAYNDEKGVYVLNGWKGIDGTIYEGWLAAARIGGMIAAFPCETSITHNVIDNALELIEPLTNGEIIKAEQKGCLVLSLNDSDQVWIDNAINTLVTTDATMDAGWKKIRRTKTRFELMDRINTTHDELVGNINNDADGRATAIAAANSIINEMVAEKKLLLGSYVYEDTAHPAEGDSAWFTLAILDIDSLEHIYLTYEFRFGQSFNEE